MPSSRIQSEMMNHTPSAGSMIHRYCIKFINSQTQTTSSVSAASQQVTILCYKNFTVRKFLWAKIAPKAHLSFSVSQLECPHCKVLPSYFMRSLFKVMIFLTIMILVRLRRFIFPTHPLLYIYIYDGIITFYNMIWCNRHGPRFWRNLISNAYWIRILE